MYENHCTYNQLYYLSTKITYKGAGLVNILAKNRNYPQLLLL